MSLTVAELERRLANVVRYGTVTEVDPGNARARVTFGGETSSAWLPFTAARAGGARVWAPPVVGEQVMIFSPMGDTGQGVIMGSLPSADFPAAGDGGSTYTISLPGGVTISVAGGAVAVTAPGGLQVTGDIVATGDVVGGGVSLIDHVHDGVATGSDTSNPPV